MIANFKAFEQLRPRVGDTVRCINSEGMPLERDLCYQVLEVGGQKGDYGYIKLVDQNGYWFATNRFEKVESKPKIKLPRRIIRCKV